MSENLFFPQASSNSQEDKIESKFKNRNELSYSQKSFSQIKDDSMNNEISLVKSFREKQFIQKRIKQKIEEKTENHNNSQTLFDKLTISRELYDKCNSMDISITHIKEILIAFNSKEIEQKFTGLVGLRRLLTLENPPIQLLLDMNVLPNIIELLDNSPAEFKYEALWCLINISSGNEVNVNKIKYLGGIDKIVSLLDNDLNEIKELAIWNLDNFCYESSKICMYFIHKKLLNKIITILSVNNNEKITMRSISLIKILIKNLNKKKIKISDYSSDLNRIINIVSRIIMSIKYNQENPENRELYYNCLYILSALTNYKFCRDSLLINGVLPYLTKLIKECNEENDLFLVLGGVKIIGNIIAGNANQTQKALDCNIFALLKELMFHKNKRIKKEANWIISNVAAGTEKNITDLIDNGFFPLLCQIFHNEEKDISIEAIWSLCNFSQIKKKEYIKMLLNQGLLGIICECLKNQDAGIIAIAIESLYNLLEYGKNNSTDGDNLIALELEKMGMLDYLESLQYHPNEKIYEKVLKMIETFLPIE